MTEAQAIRLRAREMARTVKEYVHRELETRDRRIQALEQEVETLKRRIGTLASSERLVEIQSDLQTRILALNSNLRRGRGIYE